MSPHALRRGGRGLVDVDPLHRRTGGVRIASPDGVVENHHLGRPGHGLQQEVLDLGVIVLRDARVVGEILLGGGREVGEDLEGVLVEGEGRRRLGAAGVADEDLPGVDAVVAGREAGFRGWVDVVVRRGAVKGGRVEVEGCGYGAAGDVGFVWVCCC